MASSAEEYLAQVRRQSRALPRVFVASAARSRAHANARARARNLEIPPHRITLERQRGANHSVHCAAYLPSEAWKDRLAADFRAARERLALAAEVLGSVVGQTNSSSDQDGANTSGLGGGGGGRKRAAAHDQDPDLDAPGEITFAPARGAENEFDRHMFQLLRGGLGRGRNQHRLSGQSGTATVDVQLPPEMLQKIEQLRSQVLGGARRENDWIRRCLGLRAYRPTVGKGKTKQTAAVVITAANADADAAAGNDSDNRMIMDADADADADGNENVEANHVDADHGDADLPSQARTRTWECELCLSCCNSSSNSSSPAPASLSEQQQVQPSQQSQQSQDSQESQTASSATPESKSSSPAATASVSPTPAPALLDPSLELLLALDQVHTCKAITELVERFLLPQAPKPSPGGASNGGNGVQNSAEDPSSAFVWLRCCPRHHPQHSAVSSADPDPIVPQLPSSPSSSVLCHGAHESASQLPNRVFVRQPLLSDRLGCWLYSLLLRLDLPLYPEMAALLRDLFRACAEIRALQPAPSPAAAVVGVAGVGVSAADPGSLPSQPSQTQTNSIPPAVARCNLLMTVCDRVFSQLA